MEVLGTNFFFGFILATHSFGFILMLSNYLLMYVLKVRVTYIGFFLNTTSELKYIKSIFGVFNSLWHKLDCDIFFPSPFGFYGMISWT